MKITTNAGKWKTKDVEALIVPIAHKERIPKGLPRIAEQLLKDAINRKEFSGKAREIKHFVLPASGKKGLRRIIVIGIGKPKDLKAKEFGELVGQAIRGAQSKKISAPTKKTAVVKSAAR